MSRHAARFLGAEQDFHFGVQYNQAGVSGVYGYNDFIYTYLVDGEPYGYGNVRQPFSYAAQIRNIGAFVDSNVRIGDRVTLNLGVRADYSKALAPEQEELDDNAQPTGRTFPQDRLLHLGQHLAAPGRELQAAPATARPSSNHIGAATIRRSRPASSPTSSAPTSSRIYQGTYNFATGEVEDLFLTSSSENLRVSPDLQQSSHRSVHRRASSRS